MTARPGEALTAEPGLLSDFGGVYTFHPIPGQAIESAGAAAVPPPTPSPSAWANTARDAANDARCALLNNGYLRLYSTGFASLLVELVFPATAFNPSNGAISTLTSTLTGAVILAGTIASYRAYASDGVTLVCSGTVSGVGGGGNIEIASVVVSLTDTVQISTLVAMQG